jgi:RNase P subunit RPR2
MSDKKQPRSLEWKGKTVTCGHCAHELFHYRRAQLNTKLASLFNVDWANKNAHCYICANCGHIEWFLPPKEQN